MCLFLCFAQFPGLDIIRLQAPCSVLLELRVPRTREEGRRESKRRGEEKKGDQQRALQRWVRVKWRPWCGGEKSQEEKGGNNVAMGTWCMDGLVAGVELCLSPFRLLEENTTDWVAHKQQTVISHCLQAGRMRSECQHGRVLVKAFFWVADSWHFALNSHGGGKGQGSSLGLLL